VADIDRSRTREERVVQVAAPQTAVPAEATDGAKAGPSIAVLPFANMSGDAEQEYFADGMVEEIITGLSRIRWLTVIARNSSFAYKGTSPDVRAVGRALNVRYVLEGSVRKGGARVRITGQLIEAETGGHLWADKFDGTLADVFELQDQITGAVVGAIEPNLRTAEIERAKRKRPDNLDAYDLYLQALAYAHVYTPESRVSALALLDRSLALAPDYAEAHGVAAWCHNVRFNWDGNEDSAAQMVLHARAVISLKCEDAATLSFAALGLCSPAGDLAAALVLIERALALNPSCAQAHTYGALVNVFAGRSEKATAYAERSLRLSPLDPLRYMALGILGGVKAAAGDFEGALALAQQSIQVNPRHQASRIAMVDYLVGLGRLEDARSAMRELRALWPGLTLAAFDKHVMMAPEARARRRAALAAAGLPE